MEVAQVGIEDLLESLRASRRYFLKHLDGLPNDLWTWKPYAECKNVLETLAHMRIDDLTALESLKTGKEPDYEGYSHTYEEIPNGSERLLELLARSRQELIDHLGDQYGGSRLETPICVWGDMKPLAVGVPYYSSEDFYHAGQVAFIRLAAEPGWNYYKAIYGMEF